MSRRFRVRPGARRCPHFNQERYEGQRVFVVRLGDYAYLVPFVEDRESVFLKTIIPSRKATGKYLGKETEPDEA